MAFLSRSEVFPLARHARRSKHSRLGHQATKLAVETMESRTLLSLFMVSNPGDNGGVNPLPNTGTGTLRQAIVDSNATAGPNVIDFSIGGGHQLITLASTLPEITNTVTIDGTSQPGSVPGTPLIEISGNGMSDGNMMTVSAPNCTIKGLVLNDFVYNYTLLIKPGADNAVVQGNYFGTDATGTVAVPNYAGIGCFAHNITIGGMTAAERNIVSGSQAQAIFSYDDLGTKIEGNYIGTNAAGTAPLPNVQGVIVSVGTGTPNLVIGGTTAGAGNVISGNFQGIYSGGRGIIEGNKIGTDATGTVAIPNFEGIFGTFGATIGGTTPGAGNLISGNVDGITGCNGSTIQGNLIGTDVSGTAALANTSYGIGSVSNCLIGGMTSAARNVISGNRDAGIGPNEVGNTIEGNYLGTDITGEVGLGGNDLAELYGVSNSTIVNNLISTGSSIGVRSPQSDAFQGNLIGTNMEGTGTIGNVYGLFLDSGSLNNTIGGTSPGQGNVIAGNIYGINFTGPYQGPATDYHTVIEGNLIGTTADGSAPLGNSTGIYIAGDVTGVTIGGTAPGSGNVVADNGTGILLRDDVPTFDAFGVSILGNSIYGNTGLGINLVDFVPNELGNGPNGFQNFPVLNTAGAGATSTVIGTFNSTAGDTFRIEFFASPTGAPSGYGQGQRYLGYTTVTTDGSGNASFNVSGLAASSAGEAITATATVLTGPNAGSTSEFSAWITAANLQVQPTFSNLTGATITFGTPSVTLGGTIAAGAQIPSGNVAVTIGNVTQNAAIQANGSFSTVFNTATLAVAGSPYAVNYSFAASGNFLAATDSSQTVTVNKATPTLTVNGVHTSYNSAPHPATFTITGINGDNLANLVMLAYNGSSSAPINAGTYAITATFTGNSNYNAVTDTTQKVIIDPAATSVALATATNPSVPGQYVTFTATVSAASGVPTPIGSITFKDGNSALGTVAIQNGVATITVPLTTLGSHALTAAYTPGSTNYAAPAQPTSLSQTVQPVALEPGPQAGQSVLYVGGTAYNDVIEVEVDPKSSSQDKYEVEILTLNGCTLSEFDASGIASGHIVKVVGFANGRNDLISVSSGTSVASWLFGGPGNNILSGGDGNNVLVGGAGDNILFGGVGRSLLIAGAGQSVLYAGSGDSILIGGTTSFDAPTPTNLVALDQVMAEWTSADSYATRVADLSGTGSGPSFAARLNGNTFLSASGAGATVFDNGESDLIVGGSGTDWFFADLTNSDGDRDTILNQKKKEILTSLS
jgi:Bacterial Ig-like domain (group 3)/RTX calcium-binding nonapeptide repeat (4 copies)/MBG domain